jgi:translocation and assembly module TamA
MSKPHISQLIACISGLLLFFGVLPNAAQAGEPLAAVKGKLPDKLRSLTEEVVGEADAPARSLAQARRRVIKAGESVISVMRSQGYYSAEIDAKVIEAPASTDEGAQTPPQPVVTVRPGPQFLISSVDIIYVDNAPAISGGVDGAISLRPGDPAVAAEVVATELELINYLNFNGFPDAKARPRKAVVDHGSKTLAITLNIETGQRTRFGDIKQVGTAKLSETWPKMVAPFKSGEEFDVRKLNTLSSRIIGTSVFAGASASLSEEATQNTDGTVTRHVLLNVDQGGLNSISGEIGFSTTQGNGVDLTYQRKNFVGYAQTLKLTASAKTNQLRLSADYNIPFAWRVERELDLGAEIAREDTDAFTGERFGANALLTRKFGKKLKTGVGFGLEASKLKDGDQDVTSYLFDGLGRATYDSRNSLFDPETGVLLEADIVPSYNFSGKDGFFTTSTIGASSYRRLSATLVAAGRAKLGTIFGEGLSAIPINRRFYGGGGGSVRGFGYQTISPVSASGELTGGRSIAEVGAELRYKGSGPIGFAGFVDAGSVTQNAYPDFINIRAGAGVGLRYYTGFLPLRADIAIPLNKREGDNPVQIYISLGQAF